MKKYIYENKETKQKVVTGEKLDAKHWKKVTMIKGAKMEGSEIHTK